MRQEGEARPVGVTGRACWSAGLIIPETGHDRGVTEGFGGRGASWPMPPLCPLDNMTQRSRPGRLEAGCDSQACGRGGLPRSSPVEPQSPPGLQTEQESPGGAEDRYSGILAQKGHPEAEEKMVFLDGGPSECRPGVKR